MDFSCAPPPPRDDEEDGLSIAVAVFAYVIALFVAELVSIAVLTIGVAKGWIR
jgi:hypothetical protein